MIRPLVKQLIAQELTTPTWEVTKQFLTIHRIEQQEGEAVVLHIADTKEGYATAYLAVEETRFYLAISIDTTAAKITNVHTEAFHDVWLRATSEKLTTAHMLQLTSLTPLRQYTRGDSRRGTFKYTHSVVDFRPHHEPDTFENHVGKLLDLLEQDADGIRALANETECIIRVASYFHNGNTVLGGHFLDARTLKRISNLNLALDFDLYVEGNFWPEVIDE
ncbi:DUF4279 domain-containing protein [Hymenobacter swuensis]|uniref:DUF4279 domain-containing protein n=1 Tax=Hymenobacter swuensis DY53 TaxID=1227739 RepID=W8F401_9BACT|nr:DUF4279 domain-containing protein [Hymenobacter swuensis]AHJ96475.1 hypothetical protein Hsw_0880 [Hymenobacter swuensis DY53]